MTAIDIGLHVIENATYIGLCLVFIARNVFRCLTYNVCRSEITKIMEINFSWFFIAKLQTLRTTQVHFVKSRF